RTFHSNTCTHKMNVVSTAFVLSHTPADINALLSMVFVGPRKFDPNVLRTVFYVCHSKIWVFLI
ncbi:hypothetical protein EV424DRAFT_1323821, partial [Suillus variegatus]